MFLLIFSKYWRHILDALLLVAVIVFVFLWNPFNIFGKGLRLQRTSNLVSSVRSIGQLVSAEYYGEVMASLNEAQLNQIEEKDLEARAEAAYFDLKKQAFEQITASLLSRYSKADLEKGDKKINRKAEKLLKSALGASLDRYNSWNNSLFREDTADVVLLFFGKYIDILIHDID